MKKNPMIILVVEPGKKPVLDVIDDSLESMQKVVGGYIETIYPFEDEVVLVCNEEGKINGSPLNRAIYNTDVFSCFNGEILDIIAGTFFLCYAPANSDSFLSLPEKLIYKYADLFDAPEKFYRDASGKIQVEKVECDNDFLGINWQFYEHRCFVEIEFTDNKDYKTVDFRSVEKDSDTYKDIDNFAKICAGKNAINFAKKIINNTENLY